MAYYMVFWPQDRVRQLAKAKDEGPIRVVLGSILAMSLTSTRRMSEETAKIFEGLF